MWPISQRRRGINSHFVSSHRLLSLLLILSSCVLPLLDQCTVTCSVGSPAFLLTRNSALRYQKPVRDRVPNCGRTCHAAPICCVMKRTAFQLSVAPTRAEGNVMQHSPLYLLQRTFSNSWHLIPSKDGNFPFATTSCPTRGSPSLLTEEC